MLDITLANFEEAVIQASHHTPILVDFWAPWCGPCKSLGPVLEAVETEYAGRFQLAKINSDDEQQLASAFGIRSVPTCVLMIDGKPVDGFQGALSTKQVKEFLDKHLPPATEEQAPETDPIADALAQGDVEAAINQMAQAVQEQPQDDGLRFDWIKLLLQQGLIDDAKVAFAPVIAQAAIVRQFDALKQWMNALDAWPLEQDPSPRLSALQTQVIGNKRDFDARFAIAQCHMACQQWTQALDELLEILMRDKAWNQELARKTYIAILEIMEPPKTKVADGQIPPQDPLIATYRRRLSSVVLS